MIAGGAERECFIQLQMKIVVLQLFHMSFRQSHYTSISSVQNEVSSAIITVQTHITHSSTRLWYDQSRCLVTKLTTLSKSKIARRIQCRRLVLQDFLSNILPFSTLISNHSHRSAIRLLHVQLSSRRQLLRHVPSCGQCRS